MPTALDSCNDKTQVAFEAAIAARKVTSVVPGFQIRMGSRTSTENLELIHRLIDPSLQHQLYRPSLPRLDARIAAEIGTILSTSSSTLNIPPSLMDRTGQAACGRTPAQRRLGHRGREPQWTKPMHCPLLIRPEQCRAGSEETGR